MVAVPYLQRVRLAHDLSAVMADFFVSGSWPKKGGTTDASGYEALVPYRDEGFCLGEGREGDHQVILLASSVVARMVGSLPPPVPKGDKEVMDYVT